MTNFRIAMFLDHGEPATVTFPSLSETDMEDLVKEEPKNRDGFMLRGQTGVLVLFDPRKIVGYVIEAV